MIASVPRPAAAAERVLHVMWSLTIGGAERAVYQLVLGQLSVGWEVGVLIAGRRGLYGDRLEAAGVHVDVLGQTRGFEPVSSLRARAIFEKWPVVHFHVAEPLLMIAATTTRARTYYSHRAGAFAYPMRRRLRYRATGFVVRNRFDGVVGNTAQAAGAAARLFCMPRDRVGVVYNGIDWTLLTPERAPADVRVELGLGTDSLVFGTSGNLRAWKRVDIVLRALQRSDGDVTLVIVGDGPERLALERLAKELSISHRVRFAGRTSNVADYLQVFDAFVLPSGPEESFGNSAVEAMGFGLPTIVMRDGGGLTEHVEHELTGIVANDVDDLTAWICALASNRELRQRLGTAGRDSVLQRYTTLEMVEGYDRLYASSAPESNGA